MDETSSEADFEGPSAGDAADPPAGESAEQAASRESGGADPDDPAATFLDRLDRRQNQVLKQLDQLNARIEQLLDGFRRA